MIEIPFKVASLIGSFVGGGGLVEFLSGNFVASVFAGVVFALLMYKVWNICVQMSYWIGISVLLLTLLVWAALYGELEERISLETSQTLLLLAPSLVFSAMVVTFVVPYAWFMISSEMPSWGISGFWMRVCTFLGAIIIASTTLSWIAFLPEK